MRAKSQEYILQINLYSGQDIRRFCEIRVKSDNVYVFQPEKSIYRTKVSYHASGQHHLKLGKGPAMFVRQEDRTEWIRAEKNVFSKSLENFSALLPYKGQQVDERFDLELPSPSPTTLPYIEVSIGQIFEPKKNWTHMDVSAITLAQKVFSVLHSPSELKICVRLFRMQPAETPEHQL